MEAPPDTPPPPTLEIKLRYDVWEEQFVVLTRREGEVERRRFARREEAIDVFMNPEFLPLAPLESLPEGIPLQIAVRVALNPADEEEMKQIQEWIRHPLGADAKSGWIGAMIGALVDERSGFAQRLIDGITPRFQRRGKSIHVEN